MAHHGDCETPVVSLCLPADDVKGTSSCSAEQASERARKVRTALGHRRKYTAIIYFYSALAVAD